MPRWSRSLSGLIAVATIGVAVFGVLVLLFAGRATGSALPTSLGVALASGVVVGTAALMLLGSRPIVDDDPGKPNATTCSACGSPLIDKWRLCPHCGQMLECDTGTYRERSDQHLTGGM